MSVGGTGVAVGGSGVSVGGTGVAVEGTGVVVGGGGVTELRFVLFSDDDLAVYRETAPRIRDEAING